MSNEINIESLLERLRAVSETGCDPDLPHEAADALEALVQRAEAAEQLATARGHTIQGLRYELAEVKVERDTLAPEVQQAGPVRLTDGWISVADAMPNTQQQVDIAYIDHHGRHQTTMGWYCRAKTLESSSFDGEVDEEYDEETDTYYMKEQWVDESQEAEYHYPINNVTHWKPRAKHPDFNLQAKGD